jgi:hypothetical protein
MALGLEMKSSIAIFLLLLASTAVAKDSECSRIPERYRVEGPFTVSQLEAESLEFWDKRKEKLEGRIPRVPFGKGNAEWKQFVSKIRKGDKLLKYDEGCCTGIILVRGECIVEWFQLSES